MSHLDFNVAFSAIAEDEILIYDLCGRYIPIPLEDLDILIQKLDTILMCHELSKNKIDPADLKIENHDPEDDSYPYA